MDSTHRLEEVVTRLTPEQYERLVAFAESLAAETDQSNKSEITDLQEHLQKSFPTDLRQRLRELTKKSESEILTETERDEYIALAEKLEIADSERLNIASRLSVLRGISFSEALKEIDAGVN